MKKLKLNQIAAYLSTLFLLLTLVINVSDLKAQDTLVYWDFPTKSQVATGGIPANINKIISRENTFAGNYLYTNADAPGSTGDSCIYTTAWNAGVGTKYWQIEFSTDQYDSVKVSSKQSSTATGPRDFQIEYSLDGTNWFVVPNSSFSLTTASDWVAGTLSNVKLPSACWGQPSVSLRWIMTSDININGTSVASAGNNKIDDIYITGSLPAPPVVNNAYAISDSVVVVVFSKAVDTISATTLTNYSFQGSTGIDYIVRTYPDTVNIFLDPKLVVGIVDSITIENVIDLSATPMALPQRFEILIAPDTIPPIVLSVNTISCNVFEIRFSEPVDAVSATDLSNYLLTPNAIDSIAEINVTQDVVTLTLHLPGLASGSNLDTLVISGIEDKDGNIMDSIFTFPLSCLINECIVFWDFNNQNTSPAGGIPVNLTSVISRESSFTGNFSFSTSQGSPAPSISSSSWHSGTGVKYWEISFASYFIDPVDGNAYNYDSLKISSAQRSSDSGPQDFQLQYYDDGTSSWVDITGGNVTVKNNWTNGVINNLELPEECWGKANVRLRWLITSEVSSSGGTVASAGVSNFDEIYVCGYKLYTNIPNNIAVEQQSITKNNVLVFPNPSNDVINIITSANSDIELFDVRGRKMYSESNVSNRTTLDVSSYSTGLYILSVYDKDSQTYSTQKIMIK